MNELRVPKRRTQVEIVLPGGLVKQCVIFLGEFAPGHSGAERLSDLLNGDTDFIPAVEMDTDAVTFLNRVGIALARVSPDVEPVEDHTIPTEHEVEITLVDGKTVNGLVTYMMPPDRSRLTDFLNDSPPFFRLVEKDRIALVNKRHVARVTTPKK